ncbi:hypothetical protein AKJ16_DCAP06738 [Drosera capensis]
MEKPSWLLTVLTQISLCFALYLALNLGQPHFRKRFELDGEFEVYFISVRGGGGFRSVENETILLRQMEMAAKTYDVKFVASIGRLGNGDQILHTGTRHFTSLRVPWYTVEDSEEKDTVSLLKRVELPLGKSLDVIAFGTSLFQDSQDKARSDQLSRLTRLLDAAHSHWSIVFGSQPMAACEEGNHDSEINPNDQHLHHGFLKYRVNAYVSGSGCVDYAQKDNVAYMTQPGPSENRPLCRNRTCSLGKLEDGFLFHRASLLEFETYFVTLNGNAIKKVVLHQSGAQAI